MALEHQQEADLRKRIREIYQDSTVEPKEKARRIQHLMNRSTKTNETLSEDNAYTRTYHSKDILGCPHYQRKAKLQASCCWKIVSCRFCHDEKENHPIIRHETKNMLCMICLTLQPAAQNCQACGTQLARYYCDKCKLWDDDPEKSIYHCDDCGLCRQGKGLGIDFFHCPKCNVCMTLKMKDNHRCIERNLESDCPICGEYMFTSTTTAIFMPCGHSIHRPCYIQHRQTSYQCPTCLKSVTDMSKYFTRLDQELANHTMPAEYEHHISHIFCNDCEKRSFAKYHFFHHKCSHCKSYNTTVLKIEKTNVS